MYLLRLFVLGISRANEQIGRIIATILLVMVAVVVFEVMMRYALRSPTQWASELVGYIFAGYVFLGAGYTLLHREHVNMDVFYAKLPPRAQAGLDVLTAAFAFIYCGVLLMVGWDAAWGALLSGRTTGTDWNPPLFPALVMLPIGTALLIVQLVAKFVRDLVYFVTGQDLAHEH